MDGERPNLRPVSPDEAPPPPDRRPAHERAREFLEAAQGHLGRRADDQDANVAAVLAVLGQAWATLALTEPVEADPVQLEDEPSACPVCAQRTRVVLSQGLFDQADELRPRDRNVPIVGCGNPWHYVFPQA